MIYFTIALLAEAKPLLSLLKLPLVRQSPFAIYGDEDYTLIITGMCSQKALMATTHLLTLYPPSSADVLVNFGLAGATTEFEIGELVSISSLRDKVSDKIYYPDMRLSHPYNELALTTVNDVQTEIEEDITCVDMEAFFVYEASLLFLKSSQILFFKLISDHFSANIPSKDQVNGWISPHLEVFIALIQNHQSKLPRKLNFSPQLQIEYDKTIEVLKLTVSQINQLNDRLKGYILKHQKEPLLPKHLPEFTQHKKEQKDAFNKLINLLSL
jgi:hypothetical protein